MTKINISTATSTLLAEASEHDGRYPTWLGKQQPGDTQTIEIDDDVHERLQQLALPGETIDDTITRVIRHYIGKKPS